jgi:hypothetical protein
VLTAVQQNPIYVDGTADDWGHPAVFLRHLATSNFIHTVDQYIGITAGDRYRVGVGGTINYPIYAPLDANDTLQIVHAAAAFLGSGYGHLYHVFFPKGVDVCAAPGICYSPDNPSTFYFCAYHGSVDFPDIGHVLFSVEPYQNIQACAVEQPSPNGSLIDSTANVLSHETIEAITDPDLDAWWAQNSGAVFGEEIGDLCVGIDPNELVFKDPITALSGRKYEIQFEYSNTYHACANRR